MKQNKLVNHNIFDIVLDYVLDYKSSKLISGNSVYKWFILHF